MNDLLLDMSDNLALDSKDVLDKIKADGTFDQMRMQVTEAVKQTVLESSLSADCFLLLPATESREVC